MSSNIQSQDVMQVCRNGHVITDLLHTYPERGASHCERCGSPTMDRCLTCGQEIRGAVIVPGLQPIGQAEPPLNCASCGVAFPWALGSAPPSESPVEVLARMLRRLPRVIRQLRVRQGDRPPFRVSDERDLEDLLRALLTLQFDDVRPESRTASYSPGPLTDFLIESQDIVVTSKRARSATVGEAQIAKQIEEDLTHYEMMKDGGTLICFIYDPESCLRERPKLEAAWAKSEGELQVRCVIA